MITISSPAKIRSIMLDLKRKGKSVGFVPTMGALHDGHLSLIKKAAKENDVVAVSIFVNPSQFGPKEDYLKYPRPAGADKKLCADSGVNYLFLPKARDMYPSGYSTYVNVEKMSDCLCGNFRPGHFRGVATIVLKLLNIIQPSRAYFGKKDYQQLSIIKKMCSDLNVPVGIIGCETVRETSGLAMSSRNRYLRAEFKAHSAKIYKSLQLASDLIKYRRLTSSRVVVQKMLYIIKEIPGVKIDYISISDPDTLMSLPKIKLPALVSLAVWVGGARLIDNILVEK